MFKTGFDKYTIVGLCHLLHPDITRNQSRRWSDSLRAIEAGTFFDRPNYVPPHAHELHYHEPMWNKLQSSYADVEAESSRSCVRTITASTAFSCSWVGMGLP
eukprot:3442973-Pleurochrysis_carterae.AAC.1